MGHDSSDRYAVPPRARVRSAFTRRRRADRQGKANRRTSATSAAPPPGDAEARPPGVPSGAAPPPGDAQARPPGVPGRAARLRAALTRSLFPEVDEPARLLPRWLRVGLATLFALSGVALAALRLDPSAWDALWAEDGTVFLQAGLDHGPLAAVFQRYAGYAHVWPRLATAVVMLAPLGRAGYAYTLAAAAVVAWVAWTAWYWSRAHLRSRALRLALAAAVVALPVGSLEAAGNVANGHFYLLFGAFWALLGRSSARLAAVSAGAIVLLATLSDPVAVVLLPLALLRFLCLTAGRERAVTFAYLCGMGVQAVLALGGGRPDAPASDLAHLVFGYNYRVVSPIFVGLTYTEDIGARGHVGAFKYITLGVVFVLGVGVLVARRNRLSALGAGAGSVVFFLVAWRFAVGSVYPPSGGDLLAVGLGSRYVIVPSLLLLSAWLLVLEGMADRLRPARYVLVGLGLAPVVVFGLTDYRVELRMRSGGTPWSESVEAVAAACRRGDGPDEHVVPIQPPGGQDVTVRCRHV